MKIKKVGIQKLGIVVLSFFFLGWISTLEGIPEDDTDGTMDPPPKPPITVPIVD